jgi:cytochrome b involved in lipid metabolism
MPPERDDDNTLESSLVDLVDVGLVNVDKDKKKAPPFVKSSKSSNNNTLNSVVLRTTKTYTIDEVAKHTTPNSTWIIYNNCVLDVTSWVHHHPGGEQTIARFAGMDATDEIRAFHDDWIINSKLTNFIIGTVVVEPSSTTTDSELVQDFRTLGETFDTLGYFTNSKYYYINKLISVFTLFALS